jgi:hypothetical protein
VQECVFKPLEHGLPRVCKHVVPDRFGGFINNHIGERDVVHLGKLVDEVPQYPETRRTAQSWIRCVADIFCCMDLGADRQPMSQLRGLLLATTSDAVLKAAGHLKPEMPVVITKNNLPGFCSASNPRSSTASTRAQAYGAAHLQRRHLWRTTSFHLPGAITRSGSHSVDASSEMVS